jgi:hypothetical protein
MTKPALYGAVGRSFGCRVCDGRFHTEQQKRVLNRYLDGFEGNLTTKKWAAAPRERPSGSPPSTSLAVVRERGPRGGVRQGRLGQRKLALDRRDVE